MSDESTITASLSAAREGPDQFDRHLAGVDAGMLARALRDRAEAVPEAVAPECLPVDAVRDALDDDGPEIRGRAGGRWRWQASRLTPRFPTGSRPTRWRM